MPELATDCHRKVTLLCPDKTTRVCYLAPDGSTLTAAEWEALKLYSKDAPASCREDCSGECDDVITGGGLSADDLATLEPQPVGPIQMCDASGEKVGVAFVKFGEAGVETTYLGPDLAPLPEGTDTSGWKCCDASAGQTLITNYC